MSQRQILLSEFDKIYVNENVVKGSAIVNFLVSRALEGYRPLNFDFPNDDLMYVATIKEAIERKIKVLEVYGDSTLLIYQLKGESEMRDPRLIYYQKLVLELIKEFDDITFYYLSRDENQMADALATGNDKKTLRRLANEYVLDGEILYKRRKDQVLRRCVDVVEAKKILEEVHEGVYKIHVPHSPLHVMTFPWPFSMWGMDIIGPILPKASNGLPMGIDSSLWSSITSLRHGASNKNIKKIVGKMTETYKDWHEKLPFALFAYQTSVRTSTGATPFSSVYGMKAALPIEVEIPSLWVLLKVKLDEAEWIQSRCGQ
ncbi:reverse transcriptase [Gossypium australe]|uniref:Reverse transcriptase n=1 Tax=Gossypium australe TaxID=47621 RepID=A0A5B6VVQ8_9ROSI|nr:reverse transcriptase [Gossypium australe]